MIEHDGHGEEDISLIDIFHILNRYRFFIIGVTLACTALSIAISFLITPVYQAKTLLAPGESAEYMGGDSLTRRGDLAYLTGDFMTGGGNKLDIAIAKMESRILTESFIKDGDIMPILYPERWDAGERRWKDGEEVPTIWDAYNLFDNSVRAIEKDVRSGLVTLIIEWHDPVLAAKWANELVQRVNTELREEAVREAETSIAYLNEQLAETSTVEMQQAIYRLIEEQAKKIMVAKTRDQYAFKVIDPAVVPQEPAWPRRIVISTLAFLGGLMFAVFIVFFHSNYVSASNREG